jgi:hypothetical protein
MDRSLAVMHRIRPGDALLFGRCIPTRAR